MSRSILLVWVDSYSSQTAYAKAGAILGGRIWIIWPRRAGTATAVGSGSTGCQLGRAGDHGHEPAAVTDLGRPMTSRRPRAAPSRSRPAVARPGGPGRRRLIFMSRAATSVPRSAVVWTAAEADIPAGRWRPRRPYRPPVQPSAGRHGEHHPAVSTSADGCPSTGRSAARGSSPRRVAWRISSPDIPSSATEGSNTLTRPQTASAAQVRTVSELREGGRVDRTPARAEIWTHELST
jgi:hypothetical protein